MFKVSSICQIFHFQRTSNCPSYGIGIGIGMFSSVYNTVLSKCFVVFNSTTIYLSIDVTTQTFLKRIGNYTNHTWRSKFKMDPIAENLRTLSNSEKFGIHPAKRFFWNLIYGSYCDEIRVQRYIYTDEQHTFLHLKSLFHSILNVLHILFR